MNFTVSMPPSANRYWRRGGNGNLYVSDEAQAYKDEVAWELRGERPLEGDVAVTVKVFRARKSGDLDNRLKVLIDSLQGIAYVSDAQIVEIHAYRFEDKKRPRVEVEVSECR